VVKSKYPYRVHGVAAFTYREDHGVLSIKRGQHSAIKISLSDVEFLSSLKIKDIELLVEIRGLARCHYNTIVAFIVAVRQGRADIHNDLGIRV
jgi:hypothetical protein